MLILLSPTKQMNFSGSLSPDFARASMEYQNGQPRFYQEAQTLAGYIAPLSRQELADLMKISDSLAEETSQRFQCFQHFGSGSGVQTAPALAAYSGAVFKAIDVLSLDYDALRFSADHIRILSGLYGLLSPFDMIQAYRLEVKTPLAIPEKKGLYDFWRQKVTRAILDELKDRSINPTVINMASGEYSKMVLKKDLPNGMITFHFKEEQNGSLRTVGTYAKTARGKMVQKILTEQIQSPDTLKQHDVFGYQYRDDLSSPLEWVFVRTHF